MLEKLKELWEDVFDEAEESEKPKRKKIVGISAVAVVVIAVIVVLGFALSKPGQLEISAEASLKEIIPVSEVSTVEYTYNSVVAVTDGKEEKSKTLYHVAYEGIVKAGFDFSKLEVVEDKENKSVVVTVPEIRIFETLVAPESLDFIFNKGKYETETVYAQAFGLCKADLAQKAAVNSSLKEMARENAIRAVRAFCKPWESQLPEGYTVEYK